MGKVLSIQGRKVIRDYVKCRAFRHNFDGHVYQEQIGGRVGGRVVWVARLECPRCGTHRVDVMAPGTCELISRSYVHPDDYDGMLSPNEARRTLYQGMLKSGESLTS